MKEMDNKGRGSGLALIMLLIAALIVAWLSVTQLGSLGVGGTQQDTVNEEAVQQEDPVDAAQDAVDAVNEQLQQTVPEEE